MKKGVCIILGLVIGLFVTAGGIFAYKEHKAIEIINMLEEEKAAAQSEEYDFGESEGDAPSILATHYLEHLGFDEYSDFELPYDDILSHSDRLVYDFQADGRGVLVNCMLSARTGAYADVFVTTDFGKNWDHVQNSMRITSECITVVYMGDTINIIDTADMAGCTLFHISNDNGKSFSVTDEFVYRIVDKYEALYATPLILSKDTVNNTVTIAWLNTKTEEIILICEHNAVSYVVAKEFYSNAIALS